jgi:hypothetical protein
MILCFDLDFSQLRIQIGGRISHLCLLFGEDRPPIRVQRYEG